MRIVLVEFLRPLDKERVKLGSGLRLLVTVRWGMPVIDRSRGLVSALGGKNTVPLAARDGSRGVARRHAKEEDVAVPDVRVENLQLTRP